MLFRGHRNSAGAPRESRLDTDAASERACGHETHRGSCPDCQRAQLDRWRTQLESVEHAPAHG